MRHVLVLAVAILILPLALAHEMNDSGEHHNETSELVNASNSSANYSSSPVAVSKPKSADPVQESMKCAKEFECRVADYGEKTFWFNCQYDSSTGICRCNTGDIDDCDVSRSSLTRDDLCAFQFECAPRSDGNYQYGCFFDASSKTCRCSVGDLENCRGEKSLLNKSRLIAMAAQEKAMAEQEKEMAAAPAPEPRQESNNSITGKIASVVSGSSSALLIGLGAGILLFVATVLLFGAVKGDDLSMARRFHRKAESLHDKGKEEDAHRYYKLAEEYRARSRKE